MLLASEEITASTNGAGGGASLNEDTPRVRRMRVGERSDSNDDGNDHDHKLEWALLV
jgi:hypothetical protein